MPPTWNSEWNYLIEKLFGESEGSNSFLLIAGITFGTLILFGWLITNFVCSVHRGIVLSSIAQILPGAAAVLGWIAIRVYVMPEIGTQGIRGALPIAGSIVSAMIVSLLFSRKILGASGSSTLVSNFLTYACVICALILGGSLVRDVESNLTTLEKKKEQRERDTFQLVE